jgi:hypothetical protein
MVRASRLFNEIHFIRGETYLFYAEEGKLDLVPNTPEYFHWIASLKSFHFSGKNGHFTARKEQKKPNEIYWYAYRKGKKKQLKKYLGITEKLTINRLETIATVMQEEIDHLPALVKKPRKKIIPKATLRDKISFLEKTVREQKNRIEELEKELRDLKIQKAAEGHRRILKNRRKE